MKLVNRVFLSFIFLLLPEVASSQYWAPVGATWHFNQSEYVGPYLHQRYVKMVSIKDTVVIGHNAQLLIAGYNENDPNPRELVTYSDSNRVFILDVNTNMFRLLYDFNLNIGDTLISHTYYGERAYGLVIGTGTMVYGNDTLKELYVQDLGISLYANAGTITEKIGRHEFMFPQYVIADPPWGGSIRCYEDSTLGFYQFTYYPCDYLIVGEGEVDQQDNVTIRPNPTYGEVNFSFSRPQSGALTIYDLNGSEVYHEDIFEEASFIIYIDRPPGVYLSILKTNEGISRRKIIVQK